MKMKVFAIPVLVLTLLSGGSNWIPQFCAGFLDGPEEVLNPSAWNGAGWYCLSGYWPEQTIISGKFMIEPGTQGTPDCNAY